MLAYPNGNNGSDYVDGLLYGYRERISKREIGNEVDYPTGDDPNPISSGNTIPLIFMGIFGIGLLVATVCICICTSTTYAYKRRRSSFYANGYRAATNGSVDGTTTTTVENGWDNNRRCCNNGDENENANVANRNDCPGCRAARDKPKNDELWTLSMIWCHANDWCSGECGIDADDCIIGVVD